jgi:hypothetical protein
MMRVQVSLGPPSFPPVAQQQSDGLISRRRWGSAILEDHGLQALQRCNRLLSDRARGSTAAGHFLRMSSNSIDTRLSSENEPGQHRSCAPFSGPVAEID